MKNRLVCSTIFLILFFVLFLPNASSILSLEERNESLLYNSTILVPHEPILIDSNEDFITYGFDGAGKQEDPYLIESLEIITTEHKGVYITNTTSFFIIRNCYIDAVLDGIFIENVNENTAVIMNNICINNDYSGISIISSPSTFLSSNLCSNNKMFGIRFQDSPKCTLTQNTCSENIEDGILLFYSNNATIISNNCSYNENNGINLSYTENSYLYNNTCIYNRNGIRLRTGHFSNVIENKCNNNNHQGIYLYFSDKCLLRNNSCVNNFDGINLSFTEYDILEENNCSSNQGEGIRLSISESPIISNNYCVDNKLGIYLHEVYSSTIYENTIRMNNETGIIFYYSSISNVFENIIYKNSEYGLELSYANYLNISYNLIQSNLDYGIHISKTSMQNRIHHNTFVDNNLVSSSQASDDGEENLWYDDTKNEGNFWSDLKRKNKYSIDGSAEKYDLYPLDSPIIPFIPTSEISFSGLLLSLLCLTIISLNLFRGYVKKNKLL